MVLITNYEIIHIFFDALVLFSKFVSSQIESILYTDQRLKLQKVFTRFKN